MIEQKYLFSNLISFYSGAVVNVDHIENFTSNSNGIHTRINTYKRAFVHIAIHFVHKRSIRFFYNEKSLQLVCVVTYTYACSDARTSEARRKGIIFTRGSLSGPRSSNKI